MGMFLSALVPIMAIIALGYGLKRAEFLTEFAWAGIEKLTYFVLFPALLIHTLGKQTIAGAPWLPFLSVIAGTLLITAFLLICLKLVQGSLNGAAFTSVFQGGIRFNSYITLAVVQSLFGAAGLAMGSITVGFMIVIINLFCIIAFMLWGRASFNGIVPFVGAVVFNPLIIACTIGWFLSLSGIGLPWLTEAILEHIGRAALPFGLLAVGAALKPELIFKHTYPILFSSIAQFVIKPVTVALLISNTNLTGVYAGVLIVAFMTPTAPSGYILAKQLGGDTEIMASIITFQTLLAFVAMPLIALILLR